MREKKHFLLGSCIVLFLLIPAIVLAVPGVVTYQGRLTNLDGTPVDNGNYDIQFSIYNVASGGTSLWTEGQTVSVMDGIYSVTIPADPGVNPFPEDLLNNTSLYLGIQVEADSEMSPRQEITSTFYALKAGYADTLEGYGSEDFAPIDHEHSGEDITSGTISEARIPGSIARDSEITWDNLSSIPGDIADGDDVGITTESDPTVPNYLKDGVTWTEVTNRPAGLDDGDDVGIISETDPQVGAIAEGYVPRWSGTSLVTGAMYDNGTSIGLGTTSPHEQLELTGNLRLPATTSTTGIIKFGSDTLIHTYGSYNFFAGKNAGNLTMTGDFNTASGFYALHSNTTGIYNMASGSGALHSNTTGNYNTASGSHALYSNTTGHDNTASGGFALYDNTTGDFNTASGRFALHSNTDGNYNTASGYQALHSNTTGDYNTASGHQALYSNTTGHDNTASGGFALVSNETGNYNTASGTYALHSNTTGYRNTASGYEALYSNTTGDYNTASGNRALYYTTGNYNTASGSAALYSNTIGYDNTASGHSAGVTNKTGYHNTFIGASSDAAADNLTNATAIGYGAEVTGSNRVRIGNNSVTQIGGQVGWSNLSDIRHKKDISDLGLGLDFITALRPVQFRMIDGNDRLDFGFIAQDIEALLGEDYNILGIDGDPDRTLSLRYTDFIAPMVKAMQEQQEIITELRSQIAAMKAEIAAMKAGR